MRAVAVCGSEIRQLQPLNATLATVELEGAAVDCGVVEVASPAFMPSDPSSAGSVLLQVRAFSCNYRDRALMLVMARRGPPDRYLVVGSEFVADVVAVGDGVADLAPGDRVSANNSWPDRRPVGWRAGIATNHASRERLVLRAEKLAKVPAAMSLETAAGFSLGGQTAYSMLRKLDVRAGEHVLVTAARSNTSLFAINALRGRGAHVYATTRSTRFARELEALGVEAAFAVEPGTVSFTEHEGIASLLADIGGFDCVLDPFFDLHLARVMPAMAKSGRYVTCGNHDQHLALTGGSTPPPDYAAALATAMRKNVHIIGNCIGLTSDLEAALRDYAAGALDVVIDSAHSGGRVRDFLDRTYNDAGRFGKVVYRWD